MSTTFVQIFFAGLVFALIQGIAALPWIYALDSRNFRRWRKDPTVLAYAGGTVLGLALIFAWVISENRVEVKLMELGRYYGSLLHIQLAVDLLVLLPQLLLWIWPKGGAVALAAFREGWRQPMFWLISALAALLIIASMVLPYFTFGEDYKMMKQLGFDATMLAAALFGLLAASISINEEIEGRTAITVMSKPISRRQFILGKFLGTLMACWAMTMILGWVLTWCLYIKPFFDPLDDVADTMSMETVAVLTPITEKALAAPENDAAPQRIRRIPRILRVISVVSHQLCPEAVSVIRGSTRWFGETLAHHVGLLLTFGQVMVLLSICTALATRLPFIINLVICFFIFLIGHLAPVLVQVTGNLSSQEGGAALKLVSFIAQLFNTIFPALEYFDIGSAIVRSNDLPMADFSIYVASVFGYSILYSAIGLVFALILFEDRDLA